MSGEDYDDAPDMTQYSNKKEVYVPNEVVKKQILGEMTPIAAWRKHLGVTQMEMAKRLDISQASYSGIEKSQRPHKATLERVADALGVDPEQLVY